MYSLRVQLLFVILFSAAGAAVAFYFFSFSVPAATVIFFFTILASYGIVQLFVYRPLRKIQTAVETQTRDVPAQRIVVNTSDEFLRLSDSLTDLLESFQTDITRMKKLERMRTEFLGSVSHELRTPIFATQGLLETLLNGAIDDEKVNRDFLRRALNNTERLNSLLGDLIDISRIESGELKLHFQIFDVAPFLSSIVSEMQRAAVQRNISLTLDGVKDRAVEVYGDNERLRQVMVNLIDNAIKYSEPNDSVTVRFSERSGRVEISVEDTGMGIAPQHLPRIFERFYRVDRDRSRELGGTGLGLAIVKHIVEAHDTEITVESEIGTGSKFTFWLNTKP